ncbi:MAG: hypothetical protein N2B06_04875 [Clostridium sp.]
MDVGLPGWFSDHYETPEESKKPKPPGTYVYIIKDPKDPKLI